MRNANRVISLFVCLVMCVSIVQIPVQAADRDISNEHGLASSLKSMGLFLGVSDTEFELGRAPTRVEALVMLIRVLGKEREALDGSWSHPFTDVKEWADSYVGYAYENGLTNGVSDTLFGTGIASAGMYLTFILRALGYSDADGGDFTWNNPFDLAVKVGILPDSVNTTGFWRADVVIISYAALGVTLKDSNQTLAEKLIEADVFTKAQYERYYDATALVSAKRSLSAEQIYKSCSPAVFYIETYDVLDNVIASASGFFIDSEGTAVTNFHVVEEASSAKITLSDSGDTYDVLGIYDYSEEHDWALIKVDGSGFSYLKAGNGASYAGGSTVYAIGSPLGLQNSITEGLVSNPSRVDGDTSYIQISAAISYGSSGGALINKYGEVIGITSASYVYGQNVNLALPMTYLSDAATDTLLSLVEFNAEIGISLPAVPSTDPKVDPIKAVGEYISIYGSHDEDENSYCLTFSYIYSSTIPQATQIIYYTEENRLELRCLDSSSGLAVIYTIHIDSVSDTYKYSLEKFRTGESIAQGNIKSKTFNSKTKTSFDKYDGEVSEKATLEEATPICLSYVLFTTEVIFQVYEIPVSIKDFSFEAAYDEYLAIMDDVTE